MVMHVIAVSHNRLDSSNHGIANNTRMLYRCSYTMHVELTVVSHATHKKQFFMNSRMTLQQVIYLVTILRLVCPGITESITMPLSLGEHQSEHVAKKLM